MSNQPTLGSNTCFILWSCRCHNVFFVLGVSGNPAGWCKGGGDWQMNAIDHILEIVSRRKRMSLPSSARQVHVLSCPLFYLGDVSTTLSSPFFPTKLSTGTISTTGHIIHVFMQCFNIMWWHHKGVSREGIKLHHDWHAAAFQVFLI